MIIWLVPRCATAPVTRAGSMRAKAVCPVEVSGKTLPYLNVLTIGTL